MTKKKFKISIIMAVYNVEDFINEAIDSVINQSIGFKESIQLILVDDGSPDGSPAICDKYAQEYPENIFVIHKANGGVSSARNAGMDLIKGELVNFTDPDDILSENACEEAYKFYQINKNKTDVIVFPMVFFDGDTGEHTLNYKFARGTRVADLDKEWNICQLSVSSAFISAEAIKDLRFDSHLKYAEDAHLFQRVLASKCTMGILKEITYFYRKRTSGSDSALQSSLSNVAWYIPYLQYFQEDTVDFYLKKFGMVPKFIQYVLMYDLQWRLRLRNIQPDVLTNEEETEFSNRLYAMLKYIDDDVILAQRNIFLEQKIFALKKKYEEVKIHHRDNDIALVFGKTVAAKISDCSCRVEFIKINEDFCYLEGSVSAFEGFENSSVHVCINGEIFDCDSNESELSDVSLGEPILHKIIFKIKLPLPDTQDENVNINFCIKYKGISIFPKRIQMGTFFPVNNQKYEKAYSVSDGWLIKASTQFISLKKINNENVDNLEKEFQKELWHSNGLGERKAAIARYLSLKMIKQKNKPLWLISDRAAKAGDNGEAFFRYVRENHPEIDARFVIIKDCPDYERMSKIGPVLEKDSFKHKLYTLAADYIISSHAEADVFNPFVGYSEPYRDLLSKNKFIFLQHGITHNDLSGWLDKYAKNIHGFVTAALPESQSIMNYKYHYEEKNIWLTGFPRYDRLYRAEEKFITIMPTWRKYLFSECSRDTKTWSIGDAFLKSKYLEFYNNLLNDERLLSAAKKHGYQIAFFPHPNVQDHLEVFKKNPQVLFLGKETEYRDIFAKSNLLVTDYSSAIFDFAYLRKPVVYAQFDKQDFYSGAHTLEQGYFDYERDGFGEVEYTLDDTVNRLIEYIENSCVMKDKYIERTDNFFAFNDTNCCKRVYDYIIEAEKSVEL